MFLLIQHLVIVNKLVVLSKFLIDVQKYSYEAIWAVVFIVAILMFLRGRSANDNLAQEWKKACS